MKKFLFAGFLILLVSSVQAQKSVPVKKPAAKPVAKPAQSSPILKTKNDSLSYAIGLSVANFYRQQGMTKLNANIIARACSDALDNKKPLLTEDQSNLVLMCNSNPQLCETVQSGERFLAENKKNKNIKTTPSGLQYEVITLGTGVRPTADDSVTVHYKGTLINGTEFDNSYSRGAPITFQLRGVVKGWTEALQLMPTGSKYKLYIPYQLAYGLNDNGPIPGGSVLVFDVELLNVAKAK